MGCELSSGVAAMTFARFRQIAEETLNRFCPEDRLGVLISALIVVCDATGKAGEDALEQFFTAQVNHEP